jgi:cytochrome c oxidase subunit 2
MRTIALVIVSFYGMWHWTESSEIGVTRVIGAIPSANPGTAAPGETVVKVAARKFQYSPAQITVKKGTPVVLELTSEDSRHGFNLPDFRVRADLRPGTVTRVTFSPDKTGTFTFACDVFCGSGHEDMSGTLIVVD